MNPEPLNHDELVDLLPLWIGGDLDESTADRVAEAVADSDDLSERAEALAATRRIFVDGLATALESDPAPDLWPGVRDALAADGVLSGPSTASAPVLAFPWRRVAAAAALLVTTSLLWNAFDAGDARESLHAPAASGPVAATSHSSELPRTVMAPTVTAPTVTAPTVTAQTVAELEPEAAPEDAPNGLVPLGRKASQRDSFQLLHFVGDGSTRAAESSGTRLVSDVR